MVIGTRASKLALWQSHYVKEQLEAHWPNLQCVLQTFVTVGDIRLDQSLPQIGGKGLFTAELETALHNGDIDIAVHSLKDLPVDEPENVYLGAICQRADVRDVLIGPPAETVQSLPAGSLIGTSSPRRQAQLLAARPDLRVESIRGNVDSRINKMLMGQYTAVVLAAAGVERLGMTEHVSQWLPSSLMLPAPGQGAVAVQCAAHNTAVRHLLAPLDHQPTRLAVTAERAFLQGLGGGCSLPIAAYSQLEADQLSLTGLILSTDGQKRIQLQAHGRDPHQLGAQLAQQALQQGAKELLA